MSERDGFQPGVPSWVDRLGPDPRRLTDFYGGLFGWEFAGPGPMPGDPAGEYFVATLLGREVAGIGTLPPGAEAAWNTYIEVESADATAEAAVEAGGSVLSDPVDAGPAGRIAALADSGGASFCVWEPAERRGAELVNEPSAWSMSALSTPETDRAASFYAALFGWETEEFEAGEGTAWLFRLPGFVGGEPEQPVARDVVAVMMPADPGESADARWSVDFWVDDLDRALARAGELGGSTVTPAYEIPPMLRQAVIADSEGAPLSLTQLLI